MDEFSQIKKGITENKIQAINNKNYKQFRITMSEQVDQQGGAPVVPQDPEYQLQQHIAFKRRQQSTIYLFSTLLPTNLSNISLTMDGTSFVYTTLHLRNKGLQQLTQSIQSYPHLRIIDMGFNLIQDITCLQKLNYLTELNLESNRISDVRFLQMDSNFPYLKRLNLQGNKLKELVAINLRSLKQLNVSNNKIESLGKFEGHDKLQVIQMRKNKLINLKGLANLPNLKELYVADNQLTTFNGLTNVPKLQKLHARKNRIQTLINNDFPQQLQSLRYLNLRQNLIKSLNDLSQIPNTVLILNLLGCPLSEQLGENVRKQVWMKFRHYEKVNKSEISLEDKEEFDKEYRQRLAELERERLEREAAEREAKEAGEQEV